MQMLSDFILSPLRLIVNATLKIVSSVFKIYFKCIYKPIEFVACTVVISLVKFFSSLMSTFHSAKKKEILSNLPVYSVNEFYSEKNEANPDEKFNITNTNTSYTQPTVKIATIIAAILKNTRPYTIYVAKMTILAPVLVVATICEFIAKCLKNTNEQNEASPDVKINIMNINTPHTQPAVKTATIISDILRNTILCTIYIAKTTILAPVLVVATICEFIAKCLKNTILVFYNLLILQIKFLRKSLISVTKPIIKLLKTVVSAPISLAKKAFKSVYEFPRKICAAISNFLTSKIKSLKENIVNSAVVRSTATILTKTKDIFVNPVIRTVNAITSAVKSFCCFINKQVNRVFTVIKHPATVCGLLFAITASIGLRVYDNGIMRAKNEKMMSSKQLQIEENKQKMRLAAKVYKGIGKPLKKKQEQALASSQNEQQVQTEQHIQKQAKIQNTVDSYFDKNNVSEVMASNGQCKIKIGDKTLNRHSTLENDGDVYIADANDDFIVFADSAGNTYSRSITSLLR